MSDQPPTVYGYTRISTSEEVQENSFDVQAGKIGDYIRYKFRDKQIVAGEVFKDSCSGAIRIFERPKGAELNLKLKPGDHLITAKLDRMFRSAVDALITIEELHLRDVNMHFLDMDIDTTNPMGMFCITMAAGFADLERRRIGERTAETMEHLRKCKKPVNNKRPYGWDVHVIDGENKFVPNEDERRIAGWIVEAYDSSEETSWQDISDHLARKGYRKANGSAWDRYTSRRAYIAAKSGYPLYRDERTRKAARLSGNKKRKKE